MSVQERTLKHLAGRLRSLSIYGGGISGYMFLCHLARELDGGVYHRGPHENCIRRLLTDDGISIDGTGFGELDVQCPSWVRALALADGNDTPIGRRLAWVKYKLNQLEGDNAEDSRTQQG